MIFQKTRKYYWLISEFFKRYRKIIFISALLASFFLIIINFFHQYFSFTLFFSRTSKIGLVGQYPPDELPLSVKKKISLGLIQLTPQGKILPGLASSWEISPSGDKYTFILANLYWQDHTPLKPTDIKLPYKEVSTNYSSHSLTFTLSQPFSPFLALISQPILKDNKYGVGEYRLVKTVSKNDILEKIILTSSSHKLVYKLYPTENDALLAFQLGEIDAIDNLSFSPDKILSPQNITITSHLNYQKIATLFFNNNDNFLSNKSVRQALAYAIKNKAQNSQRALSPIPKTSWAFNPNVKAYTYNPTHAQQLFHKSFQGQPPTLQFYTTLPYLKIAENIAQSWQDTLGIKSNIKITSGIPDDYQVLLIDLDTSLDPDQYPLWHSTQSTNFTHYHNLKVDKLLEDGRKTTNLQLRTTIYQDFQRFLVEDAPAVFLFYPKEYNVSRKTIFPF